MRRQMWALVGEPRRSTGTLHGHHETGYWTPGGSNRRLAGDYYPIVQDDFPYFAERNLCAGVCVS